MAEKKKMRSEASSSNSGMENNNRGESVVVDVGRRRSSCGYCKSAGHTSISHGLWAHSLTVDDYQALLDKGWRRSGCFLYKPEMERTCCPSYTIRLKASEFVPSKDQRRVDKRLQRYLALQNLSCEVVSNKLVTFRFLEGALDVKKTENLGDQSNTSKECSSSSQNNDARCMEMDSSSERPENKSKDELLMDQLTEVLNTAVQACFGNGEVPCNLQLPKASVKKVAPSKKKLLVEGSEELLFSSNISFGMASALRRANKDVLCNKILQNNVEVNNLTPNVIAEVLVRHLIEMGESSCLLIRACNGHINFYSTSSVACVDDKVRTKTRSHERPTDSGMKESRPNGKSQIPIVKKRRLDIRLRRSIYDPEEYALYRKYQLRVHNDSPDRVSESSYRRFLVDTPLVFVSPTGDGTVPPCGFGSFHQQYFIDGQLIAVGVIDILPKCVSSKYLFWDPDFAILSLGKFSAVEEIRLIKENQVHCPSLQYYYLGYYIHSCNKMRYKAAYRPSELLCPLRYQWVSFDIAKPLLDRKRYVVLSDFSTQDGQPLPPNMLENNMEEQHEDLFHDGKNDIFVHEDEEMVEDDSEDSDDESDQEAGLVPSTSTEVNDGYIGEVLIGLKSGRLRYKELRLAFGNSERKYLENQLQRYVKAVGPELSQRMVYSSN